MNKRVVLTALVFGFASLSAQEADVADHDSHETEQTSGDNSSVDPEVASNETSDHTDSE